MNECGYVLGVVPCYPVSKVDTPVTGMGILSLPVLTKTIRSGHISLSSIPTRPCPSQLTFSFPSLHPPTTNLKQKPLTATHFPTKFTLVVSTSVSTARAYRKLIAGGALARTPTARTVARLVLLGGPCEPIIPGPPPCFSLAIPWPKHQGSGSPSRTKSWPGVPRCRPRVAPKSLLAASTPDMGDLLIN